MRLYTLLKNMIISTTPISKGGTGATNKADIIKNLKQSLRDLLYPVGSIYITVEDISPGEIFGGEWKQLENTFLLGAGDDYTAGNIGGESTHTLTTEEMSSHTHTFTGTAVTSSSAGAHSHTVYGYYSANNGSYSGIQWWKTYASWRNATNNVYSNGAHTHTVTPIGTNATLGGGLAHNNMPPYLVVHIWERVA